jgi:hypothetical protein
LGEAVFGGGAADLVEFGGERGVIKLGGDGEGGVGVDKAMAHTLSIELAVHGGGFGGGGEDEGGEIFDGGVRAEGFEKGG